MSGGVSLRNCCNCDHAGKRQTWQYHRSFCRPLALMRLPMAFGVRKSAEKRRRRKRQRRQQERQLASVLIQSRMCCCEV